MTSHLYSLPVVLRPKACYYWHKKMLGFCSRNSVNVLVLLHQSSAITLLLQLCSCWSTAHNWHYFSVWFRIKLACPKFSRPTYPKLICSNKCPPLMVVSSKRFLSLCSTAARLQSVVREHPNSAGSAKEAHCSCPSVQPAHWRNTRIPRGLAGTDTAGLELQSTLWLHSFQACWDTWAFDTVPPEQHAFRKCSIW